MMSTRQQKRKKLIHALAEMTGVGWGGLASPLGTGFEEDEEEDEEDGLAELDEEEGLAAELDEEEGRELEEEGFAAGSDGMVVKKNGVV
jgi:hypothetical protein